MIKAPAFLKKYFWDIDFEKLDRQKSSYYVIERLLEFGDEHAVRWVLQYFNDETIKKTLKQGRGFSKRTASFWGMYFNIPRKEMVCFKKGFPNPPVKTWPY